MKIYIATTFREFDGSENDKIQTLFLNSLMSQTYTNFTLIVTTFEEKTVKNKINSLPIKSIIFEEKKNYYKFSLTKVLENAIKIAEKQSDNRNYFIIWTTCDVVFENTFLKKINNICQHSNAGISIISHPHLICKNVNDFISEKYVIHGPNDGIDFVGFSGKLISESFKRDISNYFYSDWGIFEHFLVALAVKYNYKRINMFEISKTKKIINDRLVNDENEQYFAMSLNKNWPVFEKFLKDSKLSKEYSSLTYCNLKYRVIGSIFTNLSYRFKFFRVYINYFKDYIIRKITSYLPTKIKNIIKKTIRYK